jgi:hypothetical protein
MIEDEMAAEAERDAVKGDHGGDLIARSWPPSRYRLCDLIRPF